MFSLNNALCSLVFCLFTATAATFSADGNNDVIVLVHGFFGWGPNEMLGFNYWGGVNNIADELKKVGHDVRIGVVGPVSSNWDRAVELYAYIKGGTVDYGETHAAKFNHSRYGRTFRGIYPEWGTAGPDGHLRRIHLVGHSMGGQTIRVLLRLLAEGDTFEQKSANASSLFEGGRVAWVTSLTTVNTPHDGTTLDGAAVGTSFVNGVAWPFFKGICAVQGLFGDTLPYDFKLDQFGFERQNGEGFLSHAERVKSSSMWEEGFHDFSDYDLGVAGSREMNAITPAYPSIYYFSYASMDTEKTINPFSRHHVPRPLMWAFLRPFAYLMGRTGDASLWSSDGVVNTISQNGPKLASKDVIVPWVEGETIRPGVWNYMGAREGVDHAENIGIGVQRVDAYYTGIAAKLQSLPKYSSEARAKAIPFELIV